ncbi:SF1B family DNA helicase RecD2 [Allostreptomyces psammosilenae]|uniref:ATP-dependent RecD2 DNA helicase n=1 Tax=Allostreptomyces psammosilenae TaxID=1892865 RepID=A0A853A4C8_9ACTN|nr:ATP-dependent RecD-like DNA helicase [Allostreptomyces psammosilenae]NYI08320.1 exodeoxyribonuclease V alpha subunit [Allostreptomyces psammosilenae]
MTASPAARPSAGSASRSGGPPSPRRAAEQAAARFAVVEGVLERITYANEETGYTVARVDTGRGAGELLTVVGALLGAQPGESLRLHGRWTSHPQYGRQFTVENYTTVLPATVQGIRRYLGSGLIKGIGPRLADRIVEHFGTDTLTVIEEQPERLIEVPKLGPKRTRMIAAAWEEQKAIKEVMVFLQGVGVSTSLAVRIYKTYGDASISVVREEPYRLAADVWGIGFLTADRIAQAVGIPHDSPARVKAGLRHALSESADNGHCYLPEEALIAAAVKLLQLDTGLVVECLAELVAEEGVVREELPGPDGPPVRALYLVPFHRAEISLANQLLRLLHAPEDRLGAFADVDWARALEWLAARTGAELAPEQERAVRTALTEKVSVMTGGPGCGKSFTVRSVVELALAKRATVVLAAPTGRAAKRLAELTGHEASTVHRLLELKPGGDAAYDRDNPLQADLVVVDEASMLDLLLANKLVKAVPPGAHLLLVGDVDQLPSVGAGQVLRDLLAEDGPVPRVRLNRIFRQAQQSGVVTNAHRINSGVPPITTGLPDFFLFAEEDSEEAARLTVDVVARRIPRRFGLDPRRDVQVLAPMHRGPAGAGALNAALQEAVTPPGPNVPERRFGGRVFRVGDKVTQIRNNYDKGANGVFNGTVGTVVSLNVEEQRLTVLTDEDEEVGYDFDELDELTHAYAVTIHRSQGSEYPAVVVPLTTSAWTMLQRNLLYTAVTRARKLVVLVGSRRALGQAVRSASAGRRHTGLAFRLAGAGRAPRDPGGTFGPDGAPWPVDAPDPV